MDPKQQKALNALEQYILLTKSASSPRAAADLITQATSHPHTYSSMTANLLPATPNLPSLSPAQELKLRQLTLLALSSSHATLQYDHLLSALSIPSIRDLEDVVISAVYAGLITAKLNPLQQRVDVISLSPLRDLPPNSLPSLVSVLDDWDSRCSFVLQDLEAQAQNIRNNARERRNREMDYQKTLEDALGPELDSFPGGQGKTARSAGKRGAGEADENTFDPDGDEMDLDEGLDTGSGTSRRAPRREAKRGGKFGGILGKK
ncbi:hypothetical protein MMC25_006387 [Agyrium rufum]|nr:hypothetical protein [Agyrium rufum]